MFEKELFEELVEEGLTTKQIGTRINRAQTTARHWLKKYGLKTKHSQIGHRTWTDDDLSGAVKESKTIADVLRYLGLKVRPGNYGTVKKHIARLDLDTKHFLGRGHGGGGGKSRPLHEVLVRNSTYSRNHLKRRLLQEGVLENKCEICGLETWQGKLIMMVLDHVNGDRLDNRRENLRMLCPNCNSQQPTFCRSNSSNGG